MTDLDTVMAGISQVKVSVEEVKGDVKAINVKLEERPCARHEHEITSMRGKIEAVEKDQIRTSGARVFWSRLIPALIATVPLSVALWRLVADAKATG
jgi:hypothetical protein